jgi:hypothetical protein
VILVACLLLVALLHAHGYRLIVAGPRPGLLAVTDTGEQTVTIYETPGEPKPLVRKVLAYETAHVLDVDCLTPGQRRYWQHLRHLRGKWYAPDLAPEQRYGSGDFADVYSRWATGPAYFQGHLRSERDLHALAVRFHFTRGVCVR